MLKNGTLFAGRYTIIEKIGSGGMADVYKATDARLKRQVAVKVLKEDLSKDEEFVQRFRSEGRAAASLSNANIISIYDVGNVGDIYYFVMELIDGITLKEYIRRKGMLSPRETMAICAQVAVGLRAAHAHQIVHRDIKPQNIILSRDGKVKFTDFGIARAITDETRSMNTNTMGSVYYIAPEQAKGLLCDERSDIYSLGICTYEMITGRVPFDKDTTVAVALAHMNETMVPPSSVNPDCPTALEQIIFRCTQKSRERRYHNCTELLQDLKIAVASPDFNFEKQEQENLLKSDTLVFSPDEVENIRRISGVRNATAIIDGNDEEDGSYQTDRPEVRRHTAIMPEDPENASGSDADADTMDIFAERKAEMAERRKNLLFEEDREEDEKSIFDRILLIFIILFGALIIVLIIYIIASFSGCTQTGTKKPSTPETVQSQTRPLETDPDETATVATFSPEDEFDPETMSKIPNVLGLPVKDAMDALVQEGLQYKISNNIIYSDDYPLGSICKQSYPEGTIVAKGSVIVITLSAGTDKFEIKPSYVGGNVSVFRNDIAKFSDIITVNYIRVTSETIPANTIISIDPPSGILQSGDTVTVTYSSGPETVLVPNLYMLSEADAEQMLENVGLHLGEVSYDYSDEVDQDLVMAQEIEYAKTVKNGSYIGITLSLGQEFIDVPDVTGMNAEEAADMLAELGFDVYITEELDPEAPDDKVDTVIRQDPEHENEEEEDGITKLSKGDTVNLTVLIRSAQKEVPNVVGHYLNPEHMDVNDEEAILDAIQILRDARFYKYEITTEKTPVADENFMVASQTPAAGETANTADTVKMIVLLYESKPKVPNVAGATEQQAKDAIEGAGLVCSVEYVEGGTAGNVKSVSPDAGTELEKGQTVTIYVYKASDKVKIPDGLMGNTFDNAKNILTGAGFVCTGDGSAATSDENQNNIVYEVSPSSGTEVQKGSSVTVKYYTYQAAETQPAKVAVPAGLAGMSHADAAAAITGAGLTAVEDGSAVTNDPSQNGKVYEVSPASGTEVEKGSSVTMKYYTYQAPSTVKVPDGLLGNTRDNAVAALTAAGLTAAEDGSLTTSDPAKNMIIYEASPASGEDVAPGSAVTIRYYTYAAPVLTAIPDVKGQSFEAASAALTAAGFTPNAIPGEAAPAPEQVNLVYNMSPDAATEAEAGTAVTISYYVSAP